MSRARGLAEEAQAALGLPREWLQLEAHLRRPAVQAALAAASEPGRGFRCGGVELRLPEAALG